MSRFNVDPYAQQQNNLRWIRNDWAEFRMKATDFITPAELDSRNGKAFRLGWVLPKVVQDNVGGAQKMDKRGVFRDIIGYKITFTNLLNNTLKIRGSTPLGDIEQPNNILTRTKLFERELKPAGTIKVKEGKGKKKKKSVAEKSVKLDMASYDVESRRTFKHDGNLYKWMVTPVAQASGFTRDTMVLFDFFGIKPTINQYDDTVLNEDTDVLLVRVKVRYIVSRLELLPDETEDVVANLTLGTLPDLNAVYHVDADFNPRVGKNSGYLSFNTRGKYIGDKDGVLSVFKMEKGQMVYEKSVSHTHFEQDGYIAVSPDGKMAYKYEKGVWNRIRVSHADGFEKYDPFIDQMPWLAYKKLDRLNPGKVGLYGNHGFDATLVQWFEFVITATKVVVELLSMI